MIYYITGGARSGKSSYGEQLACELSDHPVYLATARRWDADFEERIRRHEQDRGQAWQLIEEDKNPGTLDLSGRVILVDCVTLWLTNYFVDFDQDIDRCLEAFKREIDQMVAQQATYIVISNEIGMGLHAHEASSRKFADLQGWANQYVAKHAESATLMVSGLPVQLK